MGLNTWFGFKTYSSNTEMPDLFPLSITQNVFVQTDVINIYSKILTDVLERTQGLTPDQQATLWDSCIMSESPDGLVTMLAKAMTDKKDLVLVYEPAINVLRKASQEEEAQIRDDYKTQGQSSLGVFVSFKNYQRSDMVRLYSSLEYCTIGALNKSLNLSKAIQFKMNALRSSVSLTDKDEVETQAIKIAKGLGNGKDVLLDSQDMIETSKPDLTSVHESISFLNQKRAFYLGMPESYINGIQTGGLGSTGEQDTKAVERGLKNYFFSIIKPTLEAIFQVTLSYKSQDFRQIDHALQALQTFELVSEELLSQEQKARIISQLFDLEEEEA